LDKIAGILLIALLAIVTAAGVSYYALNQPNLKHAFSNTYIYSSNNAYSISE
jgi:CHASE3 domain sensor protein